MPCRSRRVALPSGLTCHLLEWGGEEAALDHTVLLLHGFLENAWAWEETVESGLAGRFHVLALDFRGHGDSDRVGTGGEYHLPDYVADLHELIPRVARAPCRWWGTRWEASSPPTTWGRAPSVRPGWC